MTAADLLAYLRGRSRPAETRADDHATAAVHAADPGRCDEITPPTPKPPEPSPALTAERPLPAGPVWPSPRTWLTATLTGTDEAREERVVARLARLTEQLGSPLAAARHQFANTPEETNHA